ncbi:MAG: PHP domain-containing protein [Solobacterium sp.]|nr:PHP domain-containing protein [Solobacterium sp.]
MRTDGQFKYRYETHCHTAPVSKCGKASVSETVRFYKEIGYDGIFLTNHFLDGNINPEAKCLPYEEQIDYYFSDYEQAYKEGRAVGLKVFPGVELSYLGTDFLIYGLDKEWYKAHPEIMEMDKRTELKMMQEAGAFTVQAHPYREASYIDHIRLYPRSVHAAEIENSHQPALTNQMAVFYAEQYGLLRTAGSDNHFAYDVFDGLVRRGLRPAIAGMCSSRPLHSVQDYIDMVKSGELKPFIQYASGKCELL